MQTESRVSSEKPAAIEVVMSTVSDELQFGRNLAGRILENPIAQWVTPFLLGAGVYESGAAAANGVSTVMGALDASRVANRRRRSGSEASFVDKEAADAVPPTNQFRVVANVYGNSDVFETVAPADNGPEFG